MWIDRDLSSVWGAPGYQAVRVLVGPRQSGKSSFLAHLAGPERAIVSLDDYATRELAVRDPVTFLDQYGDSVVLDECHYAPALFPEIKRRVDDAKLERKMGKNYSPPSYWLTGSNRILMDKSVAESLTGRASYFNFHTLSIAELSVHFKKLPIATLFMKGGWPELYADSSLKAVVFLNDHIRTTLEKELIYSAGIEKVNEFIKVLRLTAGRVGRIFFASEIAKDTGVKSETVSDWLSFVERMMYLIRVPAFTHSLTKRLVKAPKYYFSDVAIAVRLQGWSEAEPLLVSPMMGFLFENLVAQEIIKTRDNHGYDWELCHWRTKDGEEVDFLLSSSDKTIAIECKTSSAEAAAYLPPAGMQKFGKAAYVVVSPKGGPSGKHARHVSVYDLSKFLLDFFE